MEKVMEKKDFYTVEEACALLSVSKRSLEDELRSGNIKASKRFARWYILHTDLVAYIKAGKIA